MVEIIIQVSNSFKENVFVMVFANHAFNEVIKETFNDLFTIKTTFTFSCAINFVAFLIKNEIKF